MGSPLVNGSVIRRSLSLWLMMILPFVVGCDKVPTWQEMTDPQQQQPAAQPSATTTTFAPPPTIPIPAAAVQPSKPNSAQIIAGFNSLNSTEINDHTLAEVGALTEGLETIHKIDASRSHVSDAGLAHLSRLPGLLRLDLGGTRVTSQGMQHVAKVTTLESLSLSRTSVFRCRFRLSGEPLTPHSVGLTLLHALPECVCHNRQFTLAGGTQSGFRIRN